MAVVSPLVADPEALFQEARQRQRRRQLRLTALAAFAVVVGLGVYAVLAVTAHSSGTGSRAAGAIVAAPKTRLVVVLVDVSGSMRATDVAPNRLDAARQAIRLFLDRLSPRIEVALVAFSDD